MKHRELFLSRQVETLPATHIRGKCSVTLLNETESLLSYLNKDVSYMSSKVEFQRHLLEVEIRGEMAAISFQKFIPFFLSFLS